VWARVGINPWNARKPLYAVTCPAQPGWLQPQPMTVMSMPFAPSQGALQYRLSGVAIHLQIGFAHFPCFSSAMCLASLPHHHSAVSTDTLGEKEIRHSGFLKTNVRPWRVWIGAVTPRGTLSRPDLWSIQQPNAVLVTTRRIGMSDKCDEPSGPAAGGSRRSQRATVRAVPPGPAGSVRCYPWERNPPNMYTSNATSSTVPKIPRPPPAPHWE
jgi:hypothetical protein